MQWLLAAKAQNMKKIGLQALLWRCFMLLERQIVPEKCAVAYGAMRVGGKEKYHDRDPGPLQKTIPPNKEGFVSNLSHLIWANLLLTGFFPDDIHPTD